VNARRVEDVVVLLPGILGSVLSKDRQEIWANSRGTLFQALLHGTGPLDDLALEDDRPDDDDPGDGVTAERLVGDVHMIPGLWTIDGYSKVSAKIRGFEGVVPNENFFEFPYDWRRDNRVASRLLARRTKTWLDRRRETYPDAKLVLVAHSMGGLVARHFLEVHCGWRVTRKLITIGTPYRGSMQALEFVSNGIRRRAGLQVVDLTRLARSLTSVYQTCPTSTTSASGARAPSTARSKTRSARTASSTSTARTATTWCRSPECRSRRCSRDISSTGGSSP
jgi:pimeloyl-ACP methyl ester carboxylesterase